MAGVYFIVVSDKDGKGVRHIRIDRADEERVCNHRGGRRVAVMMPREERKHGEDKWERRVYDGLYAAIEAMRRPFKLMQPVLGSPYYALMEQRWSSEDEEAGAKLHWGTLERKGNFYDKAV